MLNYKLQEMPDLSNSGKRIVYPKAVANRTISTDELIQKMHDYNFGYAPGTVKGVLEDVLHMVQYMMEMGCNVKLDGLGTFSLSIGFDDDKPNEMASDKDKMPYRKVSVKDVIYKADADLVKGLKMKVELNRQQSGVNKLQKTQYTQQDRISRALILIEKQGFFSLSDYANINNISRTKASRELKAITSLNDSPFDTSGRGSHKVWIKKKINLI